MRWATIGLLGMVDGQGGFRRIAGRVGTQRLRERRQRQARHPGDVEPRERNGQRLGPEPPAAAGRAVGADQVARDATLHDGAFGGRERLQEVTTGARERAHVAGLVLALQRAPRLGRREAGVDRHRRRLIGEEQPVAILPRQVAPRRVDVVAERHRDVAKVLAVPGGRPRGDRALADREPIVRDHRRLGGIIDATEPVAGGAGALRRVRREVLGVPHRRTRRIRPGPREQHAQQVGQRGDAADRRTRRRRAALLLQRDGGRQSVDFVDVRDAELVEQAPRVGRHRLEIPPLRLSVERAESERGLARAGHAREHHQRVARDVDVDAAQVVRPRPADADDAVRGGRGTRRVLAHAHVQRSHSRRVASAGTSAAPWPVLRTGSTTAAT